MKKVNFIEPEFRKKLLRCFKVNKSIRDYKERVKKLGFVENKDFPHVYLHKEKKLVIKFGGVVCGSQPPQSIPTLQIMKGTRRIRIQPIAIRSKKVMVKIRKLIDGKDHTELKKVYGSDPHSYNLGVYKGKIVAFDW